MLVDIPKPYHVLITDDDSAFRDVLRTVLEPFLRTIEASSGEEALDIVQHQRIDLLLIDMHMQSLTGLETVRIVKQTFIRVPCILITADATDDLRREASAAQAFSVLKKPVTRRELMQTVSTALVSAYQDHNPLTAM